MFKLTNLVNFLFINQRIMTKHNAKTEIFRNNIITDDKQSVYPLSTMRLSARYKVLIEYMLFVVAFWLK